MSALPAGWVCTPLSSIVQTRSGNGKLIKGKLQRGPGPDLYPAFSASGQDVWMDRPEHSGEAVIVSAVGARCGKAFLATGAWSAIANTHIVWPETQGVFCHWLWLLLNDEDFWERGGTAQPFIKVRDTLEKRIAFPPLAEQRRVVAKLDALTARTTRSRADLDRVPRLAVRYRRAVIDAACRGELTRIWRAQKNVPQFSTTPLSQLCTSVTDGDHQAPPKATVGVPFITISAMNDGKIDLAKATRFVPQSYLDSLKSTRVAVQGDVLYSVTGSFGISALVETDAPFVFQRHIAILKPNPARVTGEFLALALAGTEALRQAEAVATGTAQLTVSLAGLRCFEVPEPTLAEQSEIVRTVAIAFAEIDRLVAEAAAARRLLDRLDQAILAKAFRGELVPQDPNDEPASVLLDRIRAERAAQGAAKRGRGRRAAEAAA